MDWLPLCPCVSIREENRNFPIKGNAMSVTIGPNDTGKMIFALHGGFMLYNLNPMPDNGAPLAPKMFRIRP
jgi:hypothetical protein